MSIDRQRVHDPTQAGVEAAGAPGGRVLPQAGIEAAGAPGVWGRRWPVLEVATRP
ncbi:MAG TPA: hypothetical protein VJ978_01280 [Nitriliruptoraceae bacterium]|nr:hypothetical protein [Nitriliruptoraceae bacterium]